MPVRAVKQYIRTPGHVSLMDNKRVYGFPFAISIPDGVTGVANHSHDYFEVQYIYSGSGAHIIGGKRYALTPPQLFFIPPSVTHEYRVEKGKHHKHATMAIYPEMLGESRMIAYESLLDKIRKDKVYPCAVTPAAARDIENVIEVLFYENLFRNDGFETVIRAELGRMLIYCRRLINATRSSFPRISGVHPMIYAALQKMKLEYPEITDTNELLAGTHMNKRYFIRLFKKHVSFTPIQYLLRLRVEKCCDALAMDPYIHISQIAYSSGFNDLGYFSKIFRRFLRMNPRYFREIFTIAESHKWNRFELPIKDDFCHTLKSTLP